MFDPEEPAFVPGPDDPECPFCGATSECAHLLAALDETFAEYNGGLLFAWRKEFRDVVAKGFHTLRAASKPRRVNFKLETLQELWDELEHDAGVDDEDLASYLDEYVLMRLLIDLLEQDEAVETHWRINEGGPGFSSSIATMYAEDPETVFLHMMASLQRALKAAVALKRRVPVRNRGRKRPKRKSRT